MIAHKHRRIAHQVKLFHAAGCKDPEVAEFLGINIRTLTALHRALGLPWRARGARPYAPKPEDVINLDPIALLRERDMLRIEVDILRAERSALIQQGKI